MNAEEALKVLQIQMAAALGRLSRVRRLKKAAKERGSELFRYGICFVTGCSLWTRKTVF